MKTSVVLLVVALALAQLPAQSEPAPKWVRLPSASILMRFYPVAARKNGIEGRAVMDCAVGPGDGHVGGLVDCRIIDETPENMGFGQALLSMAPIFEMEIHDPSNVGARVRIPVHFRP